MKIEFRSPVARHRVVADTPGTNRVMATGWNASRERAFEGKLVAQDPANEPTALLLARIGQSRAAASAMRTKAKPHSDEFLRRAAIVSYTIRRLAPQPFFGRTQLEKTLHLAQSHLGIDLGLEFERYAAGPFDKSIYRLEGTANFCAQEVLYEFDGPRLFTLLDADGELNLVYWSDEDDI